MSWLKQLRKMIKPRPKTSLTDASEADQRIVAQVLPFTMTNEPKVLSLIEAVRYLVRNNIPGDFCECGVWRGGSMMAIALTLAEEGCTDRDLYLYDTFSGMPEPDKMDVDYKGRPALRKFSRTPEWCFASLEEVQANMASTGYPQERLHYAVGKVEETIPHTIPNDLAPLRLDTDWYSSTQHELIHLYPRLSAHGVLILDDYGHWKGARQAVDEFFRAQPIQPLLQRIDSSGRLLIKPLASPLAKPLARAS